MLVSHLAREDNTFGVLWSSTNLNESWNARHICWALQQLIQNPESWCCFLAEAFAHHHEIFCSSFQGGSLIKSLKSEHNFAQYPPLPSLRSTIACSALTHNERSSGLICVNRRERSLPCFWVFPPGSGNVDMHVSRRLDYCRSDGWLMQELNNGIASCWEVGYAFLAKARFCRIIVCKQKPEVSVWNIKNLFIKTEQTTVREWKLQPITQFYGRWTNVAFKNCISLFTWVLHPWVRAAPCWAGFLKRICFHFTLQWTESLLARDVEARRTCLAHPARPAASPLRLHDRPLISEHGNRPLATTGAPAGGVKRSWSASFYGGGSKGFVTRIRICRGSGGSAWVFWVRCQQEAGKEKLAGLAEQRHSADLGGFSTVMVFTVVIGLYGRSTIDVYLVLWSI